MTQSGQRMVDDILAIHHGGADTSADAGIQSAEFINTNRAHTINGVGFHETVRIRDIEWMVVTNKQGRM